MRIYFIISLLTVTCISVAHPLVDAAELRLEHFVIYDGSYQKLDYPMGDVDANKGVCTDVIIRSYRTLGKDLQQLVHEDMVANFSQYPTSWGLSKPDANIDHRRVPNLETFFSRHGVSLPVTNNAEDYKPGDIVSWRLKSSNLPHIGIVSDQKAKSGNYKIIHNIGWGPQINDMLFEHRIIGHFKF